MSTVLLEIGEDKPTRQAMADSWEMTPGLAGDLAAGLANLLSERGDYSRRHFSVSEENPLVRVICKGFFVSVRWQAKIDPLDREWTHTYDI